MAEFLQSYGVFILLGLLLLLMLRRRGRGGGCGMGGHGEHHGEEQEPKAGQRDADDSRPSAGCH